MWWFYLLMAVFFMGFNSFIVKKIVRVVNPVVVMFYQFLLSVPLVAFYVYFSSSVFVFSPFLLLIGVGYFCSLILFYKSLVKGDLARSGPVWSLNLLVTALLGFIFLGETINWKVVLGLFFGVLSIYFLGSEVK